jgi:hypothetical protein
MKRESIEMTDPNAKFKKYVGTESGGKRREVQGYHLMNSGNHAFTMSECRSYSLGILVLYHSVRVESVTGKTPDSCVGSPDGVCS